MSSIFFDCSMGAAGDMIMASLLSVYDRKDEFIEKMNSLSLSGVTVSAEESVKCGIAGLRVNVQINGEEEGNRKESGVQPVKYAVEIDNVIGQLDLPDKVREDALNVFRIIYEAESKVHGEPPENIHLHEVGSLDAICDIAGVCYLMFLLGVESASASAVNVGEGTVHTSHGLLPVPAPAAAEILRGTLIYSNGIKSELCTPTGAALLKYYCSSFGSMSPMNYSAVGYGMGKKDFERANCIRAFLCDSKPAQQQTVSLIETNIDDMTPEDLALSTEIIMDAGALDVFCTPIVMKKGRAAQKLSVLCRIEDKDKFSGLILKYTSSIGVRIADCERTVLDRTADEFESSYGKVRIKTSSGSGIIRHKAEFEDLKKISAQINIPVSQLRNEIEAELKSKKEAE